jgi:hypothetical protein
MNLTVLNNNGRSGKHEGKDRGRSKRKRSVTETKKKFDFSALAKY